MKSPIKLMSGLSSLALEWRPEGLRLSHLGGADAGSARQTRLSVVDLQEACPG